jgi:hypothetical protein
MAIDKDFTTRAEAEAKKRFGDDPQSVCVFLDAAQFGYDYAKSEPSTITAADLEAAAKALVRIKYESTREDSDLANTIERLWDSYLPDVVAVLKAAIPNIVLE